MGIAKEKKGKKKVELSSSGHLGSGSTTDFYETPRKPYDMSRSLHSSSTGQMPTQPTRLDTRDSTGESRREDGTALKSRRRSRVDLRTTRPLGPRSVWSEQGFASSSTTLPYLGRPPSPAASHELFSPQGTVKNWTSQMSARPSSKQVAFYEENSEDSFQLPEISTRPGSGYLPPPTGGTSHHTSVKDSQAYERRAVRSYLMNFLEEEDGSLRRFIDLHAHAVETGKPLSDATVQEVCKLQPNLEGLNLSDAPDIGDVALWAIARHCPKIEKLVVKNCPKLTTIGLRAVALRCSELRHLDLSACNVDDLALRTVASGCWKLESLALRGCQSVSDSGLVDIARSCTNLTELNVSECTRIGEVGDVSLMELGKNCPNLRCLDMMGCRHVRDEGLKVIARGCRDLTTLKLTGCKDITGNAVQRLAQHCTSLQQLSIAGCNKIRNTDLSVLANACRSLKTLDISECENISSNGLRALATRCRSLEELNLTGCPKVDDSCCMALAQPLSHLHTINLTNCSDISEKGVKLLAEGCTGLGYLNLNGCKKVGRRFLMNLITSLKFSEPAHEYYGYQPRSDAEALRAEMEELHRRVQAAVQIQRAMRGRKARMLYFELRQQWFIRHKLAKSQASIRRFLQRKRFLIMQNAHMRDKRAALIQATWRAYVARKHAAVIEAQRVRRVYEEKLALFSQRGYRGHVGRLRVQLLRNERALKQLEEAKAQARVEAAAVIIQTRQRALAARQLGKRLRDELHRRQELERRKILCAILLQRQWRIVPAKQVLKSLRAEKELLDFMWKCARKIQMAFRQKLARVILRALIAERERQRAENAATMVQRHWRAMRGRFMAKVAQAARLLRIKERKAAVRVQAAWRGRVGRKIAQARREYVEEMRRRELAAQNIQRVFRGHKGRERWEVIKAVGHLKVLALPLVRQEKELLHTLDEYQLELQKIDEMAEPRHKKLRKLEDEVKKVLSTNQVYFDSSSLTGHPHRYLTKYLQVQLSDKLTQAKEEAEIALEMQADIRSKVRETERVLRQVRRELLPLQRGIELETKELRTQRLRNRVRKELWASIKIQSVFRGFRVRSAFRSETKQYWSELADQATGDKYFYNSWTEQTRWIKPLEMTMFEELFTEKPKDLEWKEETDYMSGLTFYFNEVLMEYRWEKPSDDEEITIETTESRGSRWFKRQNKKALLSRSRKIRTIGQFEELQDPEKGATFYYNPTTMEAKWSLPPHEAFAAGYQKTINGDSTFFSSISSGENTLEDWVTVEDPLDGAVYYYNQATGESSWEIPN